MGLNRKINLIRDNNKIGEISLLCAFNIEKYSNYIVYAKEDTNINENTNIVYFGKLKKQDSLDYLVSINNEEELDYVKSIIKQLFKYSLELEEIKKEKIAFNRKLDIPKNIFDNPYNDKKTNREDKNIEKYREIEEDKSNDNREYRNRLKSLAEDIKDIKPIDKDISDTIYVNYYNEMGILLKSKLSTLKQLWTEYKLIYNEKQVIIKDNFDTQNISNDKEDNYIINKIEDSFPEYHVKDISSNFDDLLDSLSNRIEYINNYLDELRELKEDINNKDYNKTDINVEKEKLRKEKKEFEEYKRKEQEKLANDKEELQVHFNKFQSLVESFDKKIKEVE